MTISTRALATAALLCGLLSFRATALSAQSLGLEVGLAGIENYDPFTPAAGATLQVPVHGGLSVSGSYVRWTGRDGNERLLPPGISRLGYGNQAFLVTGLLRLSDPDGFAISLGAGVGWFQQFDVVDGEQDTTYDATPVAVLDVSYRLNSRLSPYFRADVEIPDGARFQYGLARAGLRLELR